jgi:hypothetical protein
MVTVRGEETGERERERYRVVQEKRRTVGQCNTFSHIPRKIVCPLYPTHPLYICIVVEALDIIWSLFGFKNAFGAYATGQLVLKFIQLSTLLRTT